MLSTPWQLSLLAALWVLVTVAAVVIVRDPGPLHPLKPPPTSRAGPLERAVRRIGRPLGPLTEMRWARSYTRSVERWITHAGQDGVLTARDFADYHLGLILIGLVGGIGLVINGQLALGIVLLLVVSVLPLVQLLRDVRARQRVIERDMPPFLELMSILLASGLTFRQALMRVAGRLTGPLAEEMRLLLNQLEFGYTPRDAFDDLVRRSPAPTVRRVVATVRQNYELGVPIAQALNLIAEEVRAETIVNMKIRAENAGTLAALVLVFLSVPAVFVLLITALVASAFSDISTLFGGVS